MFSWANPGRLPIIVAHRGSSATAPENTLAAFQQAVEAGADAIELDVHLSKDDEVIVIHDARLERTTNGRGRVRDFTLKELQQFDAGSWFHKKYSSEKIPTLAEAFEFIPDRTGINIEIKASRSRHNRGDIVDHCLKVIDKARAANRTLVSSFSHSYLGRLKHLPPSVITGCLYHPLRHFGRPPVALSRSTKSDFLIMSGTSLRKRIISSAHQKSILVGEYTVDTQRRAARALRFGVDAIYTNDPARIQEIISLLK
jgi:glycerophosphoryl diester phosphodiesterase